MHPHIGLWLVLVRRHQTGKQLRRLAGRLHLRVHRQWRAAARCSGLRHPASLGRLVSCRNTPLGVQRCQWRRHPGDAGRKVCDCRAEGPEVRIVAVLLLLPQVHLPRLATAGWGVGVVHP